MDKGYDLQVEKKMLRVNGVVGETISQMELHKTLSVEESVKKIRDYNVDIIIASEETEVIQDRVMIKGLIYQQISWINENDACMHQEIDDEFTHYVDVPGAQPGMDVHVAARLADVDFKIDGCVIEEKKIFEIYVKVVEGTQANVIMDIHCPGAQIKTRTIKVDNMVGENTNLAEIMKAYDFPESVKAVKDVDVEIMIEEDGVEVLTDQVIVKGTVYMDVYYINDQDDMKHYDIEEPFVKYIKLLGARTGMNAVVDTQVEDVEYEVDDGRVKFTIVLEIYTNVTECLQLQLVTDVEGEDINTEKALLKAENIIGENQVSCIFDGNINLYENAKQIIDVDEAIHINYRNTNILDDKVIVSGALHQQIYYVNQDDEVCQKTYYKEFMETIDIPGVKPGMNAAVSTNVLDVDHDLKEVNTISYEIECEIIVKVTETVNMYVVTDVECNGVRDEAQMPSRDECDEWPSMRFYIVQSGDTLWNIAAKYGITVADIVAVNDIDDPDLIFPGQQLLIPCKKRG